VRPNERGKVIEMMLNDLGVQIDTSSLTKQQKHDLVVRLLASKTKRYLIISVTSILLAVIVALLIFEKNRQSEAGVKSETERNEPAIADKESTSINVPSKTITPAEEPSNLQDKPQDPLESRKLPRSESQLVESFDCNSLVGYYNLNYRFTGKPRDLLGANGNSISGRVTLQRTGERTFKLQGDFFFQSVDILIEYNNAAMDFSQKFDGEFFVPEFAIKSNSKWLILEASGEVRSYDPIGKNKRYNVRSVSLDIVKRIVRIESIEDLDMSLTPIPFMHWQLTQ
jgi:hypothetical protein